MTLCNCGSGQEKYAVHDAQGIFLCYVCSKCEKEKLSIYKPEILTGYTQANVNEPIEPDGPMDTTDLNDNYWWAE